MTAPTFPIPMTADGVSWGGAPGPCGDLDGLEPTSLVTALSDLLARVLGVYEQSGLTAPARAFWQLGQPAYDCDQLVVWAESLGSTFPTGETQTSPCGTPITATLHVTISRCIPVPDSRGVPPTTARIQSAASVLAVDAYLLQATVCQYDLWGGLGVQGSVEIEAPNGAMQAVVLTLTTAI